MPPHKQKNENRAPDPRPARTRAAILQAVEALGVNGGEINVSNIVKEAGLSRSSFYSQFKEVSDIAVQLVQELIYPTPEDIEASKDPNDPRYGRFGLTNVDVFLEEFHSRRNLYAALFGEGAESAAVKKVSDMMAEVSRPAFVARALSVGKTEFEGEFAARFVAAGAISNMAAWCSSDSPVSVEVMKLHLMSALPAWIIRES